MTPVDNAPTGEERQQLLQSCKALIFKWASVHFKGYLDRLDEQLFRMADKAGGSEQSRFLQARAELQNQRRLVEKQLLEHLRIAFERFLEQRDTAGDLTRADLELALVEHDELEQSIAVASMTRRANADCAEPLYALNQRLSVLSGGHKIIEQGNPVAPAVFAEGLRAILAGLMLDTAAKLVVYKVFATAVITPLPKLYDLLNHELKQRGVLPHLRYHVVKSDSATLPEELAGFERPERLDRQVELMQLVQRLQAAAPRGEAGLVQFALPALQLVANLQPLQRESALALATAATPQAVTASRFADLPERIRGQTRAATPVDADLIEIVGLLFDEVLGDERLPDSVKALLSYLHTPFLKVALLDKAFFAQPQHPARQLLNSLMAAGERWVEPEGKHKSDVFLQMKAVVQRVLADFEDDPRLFTQLAFDFNHYLRQHARRVRLAEQRAAQAARGEDTLKEVRGQVEALLRERCAGLTLPAELHQLLFEPWAQFLAFNRLRGGEHSAAWRDAVGVVDELLAHCQLPPGFERLRRGKALLPALQQGLQTVGYDNERGETLLAALQHYQLPPEQPAAAPRAPTPPPERDPALTELAALEFGTWFEFNADQPRAQRRQFKLAWSNGRTQHYMFVNRLGQQVAVRDGAELAAGIAAGHTRVLPRDDGRPFFEKALERIAERLRRRPRA